MTRDDPDRAEWDALVELSETGVDVSEALGALQDRRAAEEVTFQALTAHLEPERSVQVVQRWADTDEDRGRRLERQAERVQYLGRDEVTGTTRWHRSGRMELRDRDGRVFDVVQD